MEGVLNEMLFAAFQEVLPLEEAQLILRGHGVVRCGSCAAGDFECKALRSIFFRMRGDRQQLRYVCACPGLGGLPKSWCFESPKALARPPRAAQFDSFYSF